jgi:hypothetical protein
MALVPCIGCAQPFYASCHDASCIDALCPLCEYGESPDAANSPAIMQAEKTHSAAAFHHNAQRRQSAIASLSTTAYDTSP